MRLKDCQQVQYQTKIAIPKNLINKTVMACPHAVQKTKQNMRYVRVSSTESTDFTIKFVGDWGAAFHRFFWNYNTTDMLPHIAPRILTLQSKTGTQCIANQLNVLEAITTYVITNISE